MRQAGIVFYRRLLVASLMAMLVFPMLGINLHNFVIRERAQSIPQPTQLWNGFVKREWQQFLEQRFLTRMGSLRSFLILSYNEAKHRLFPKRPNDHYIWTPEFGYYPADTIVRLNIDVLRHDAVKQHYQHAARRLRILQELLSHHGVAMLVVVAPPKVRLYPEYTAPYLVAPAETIMSRAISYGDVLEESGVNVLNVERIFAGKKANSPPFFTTTSFHWNFWAGCTVASEIMRKAEALTGRPVFAIDCSDLEYGKSKWADTDIALSLNIFSTDAIIGQAPFPKITPRQNAGGDIPKIVVIGDSFSDQLVYALTKALPDTSWSPGWLTRYDNFKSRQTFGMGGEAAVRVPLEPGDALSEILTKQLLVIEVSDSAVYRDDDKLNIMEYGATEALLGGLLTKTDAGAIDPKTFLTDGWRPETSEQWRTVGPVASFAIRPLTDGNPTQLALDVETPETGTPRLLNVLLDGKPLGKATIAGGRAVLDLTVPGTDEWDDPLVAQISLRESSGHPLDLLLHGIRVADAPSERKTDKVIAAASPSAQTPDHAAMRTVNLFSNEALDNVVVEGLSGLESNGTVKWRWALGPATRIKFYVDPASPEQARQVLLKFAFKNGVPIPDQTVIMRLNGEDLRRFSSAEIGVQKQVNADMVLNTKPGLNVLEIVYQDWNHGAKDYGSTDPRQLAVVVLRLSLQEANK